MFLQKYFYAHTVLKKVLPENLIRLMVECCHKFKGLKLPKSLKGLYVKDCNSFVIRKDYRKGLFVVFNGVRLNINNKK